jgi:transcriptional regulator with XRE-family HTH domain
MSLNPETIRNLRKKANWSQEELATASGLSIRTVQRVETDGSAALETQKALAAAFGVLPQDLEPKESRYLPGEAQIGTGILLTWIGIAWFFNLGISVGLMGVGAVYLVGQLFRVGKYKLPVLWEMVAQGVIFFLAGLAPLLGMEIRLGAVLLVGVGCLLIFSATKTK